MGKKRAAPSSPVATGATPTKKAGTSSTSLPRESTPRAPLHAQDLKVISANVAGLRGVLKSEAKSAAFKSLVEIEAPDVLCLQEHKLQESHVEAVQKELAVLAPGYAMHWSCSTHKKGYSGVALLVKQEEAEIEGVSEGIEGGEADPIVDQEGRLLTLELEHLYVWLLAP